MEAKEQINTTTENVENHSAELDMLKKQVEELKAQNETLNTEIRNNTISKYNELCVKKGIVAKDMTEKSMEMIQFAISMVEELDDFEEEETTEEPKEEEQPKEEEKPVEEPKEDEVKPDAEPNSEEVDDEEVEQEENFSGYRFTAEDCSKGYAFYKYY